MISKISSISYSGRRSQVTSGVMLLLRLGVAVESLSQLGMYKFVYNKFILKGLNFSRVPFRIQLDYELVKLS